MGLAAAAAAVVVVVMMIIMKKKRERPTYLVPSLTRKSGNP